MTCQSTAVIAVLCDELPRTDRDGLMPLNKPPETCLQNKKTPKPRNRTERLRENFNGKPSAAGSLDTNLTLQPQNLKRNTMDRKTWPQAKGHTGQTNFRLARRQCANCGNLVSGPVVLAPSMISAGISNSNLRKRGCKESPMAKEDVWSRAFLDPCH